MPINSISSIPSSGDITGYNIQSSTEAQSVQTVEQFGASREAAAQQEPHAEQRDKKVDEKELTPITEAMNKFMAIMNADLQFSVHEKTHRLIVRLVDTKENKVLKEFPPKEFLDTIANIQEYIGMLLDKKV